MEETILFPSPNWFLPSVLRASEDGWLVYGGPGKSLVVLEPIPGDIDGAIESPHRHKAHVIHRSNKEKVTSVDISPEWPEKRHFVSGSHDGSIKEWSITKKDGQWSFKTIHSHEAHSSEKEEVVGVGYTKATHVLSVGSYSNINIWELNTGTTKTHVNFIRQFKVTCMSCSPHLPFVVAVGTKQGVVFVLDFNGKGNIVYKVRGQDDEIAQVSWCPQYEVITKRSFHERKSLATQRLEQIRNEPEPSELASSELDSTNLDQSDINVDGAVTKLPEDSFDESITVSDDDMFDIYKDHEESEFGHKKYQPEDIVVKKKVDDEQDDFLAQCAKLKAQILKNKEEEESIETLVEAMDKAHVREPTDSKKSEEDTETVTGVASIAASGSKLVKTSGSDHIHRHLLASISKNGFSVRIWSKTGKIVSSCGVFINKNSNNKPLTNKGPYTASLHWYKPDTLLLVDGKMNLLECNPLKLDAKSKLSWNILHSEHRRGVFFVGSNAPRVQTAESAAAGRWHAYTAGQDRYLIKYNVEDRVVAAKYGTCGGFLYNVTSCPYDAGKFAIGVGDGAIRIWENQTTGEEDTKLTLGDVACYWQNVQGKILQCAWHPTKENLLAFSTAESRVGIIDTSPGRGERHAKVLPTALSNGVYSIAWGEGMTLFAVGGLELVMYQAHKPDKDPIPIQIEIEGQKWQPAAVNYSPRGLLVASHTGGVAMFSGPGGKALAAKFFFARAVQATEWHPQQTSSSDDDSQYKDLLALTSTDRNSVIVVVQYEDKEGGGKQFSNFNTLAGHTDKVLQVYWNPHRDGQLLSSSQDCTFRVWDAINGVCVSIFEGHGAVTLGAAWCARPHLADKVLSGGSDFCLRLWDINDYPADNYKVKKDIKKRKKKQVKMAWDRAWNDDDKHSDGEKQPAEHSDEEATDEIVKANLLKSGKRFLLPKIDRQMRFLNEPAIQIMLQKHLEKDKDLKSIMEIVMKENPKLLDLDFLKLFGNINEVNEVLDLECENHLQLDNYREYMMLNIFRGRIDAVMQFANEHDLLDPFLLSIAPCVSFKYWKDVTKLYIAQIDRLTVKQMEHNVYYGAGSKVYPGVYMKAAALLSVQDLRGALDVLEQAHLYKEAYVLCRCRHMDSFAKTTLSRWVATMEDFGNYVLCALIYIVMGDISSAAMILRKSSKAKYQALAAEIAKAAGFNTLAEYVGTDTKNEQPTAEEQADTLLAELPTKMELLMKDIKIQNSETEIVQDVGQNGNHQSLEGEAVTDTKV